jgi:hypothetical protein
VSCHLVRRWQTILNYDSNWQTIWFAAQGGHLKVLKFAREHDCEWDEETCAAFKGHLEVLGWAHTHGCPWNELTCSR